MVSRRLVDGDDQCLRRWVEISIRYQRHVYACLVITERVSLWTIPRNIHAGEVTKVTEIENEVGK